MASKAEAGTTAWTSTGSSLESVVQLEIVDRLVAKALKMTSFVDIRSQFGTAMAGHSVAQVDIEAVRNIVVAEEADTEADFRKMSRGAVALPGMNLQVKFSISFNRKNFVRVPFTSIQSGG